MTDLNKETESMGVMDGLAKQMEGDILGDKAGQEEALKEVETEKKATEEDKKVVEEKTKPVEEKKVEPTLPKLSAAEFHSYNSMAEHMEYFVRPLPSFYLQNCLSNFLNNYKKRADVNVLTAQSLPPVLDAPA
jgi:hypothetical protein